MDDLRLPTVLRASSAESRAAANETLQCYFGLEQHRDHRNSNGQWFRFTGALFDTWDSTGSRMADVNRFTADDVVAVSFLSVDVPAEASIRLLDVDAAEFSALLEELGPDRDLVTETTKWESDWVGWRLFKKLDALPGVGPTTASKLLARKRPRLRPIYDSKVSEVINLRNLWEPLRATLQDQPELHSHLLALRDEAGVSNTVSAIRVFDVLTWMEGADKGCARVRPPDKAP